MKACLCQQKSSVWRINLQFITAYRSNYSTETILIKITNDILWPMENQRAMIMILLDVSAAFDTMDHNILITILKEHYSFHGKALHLFEQYLRPCNFKVCINREYSNPKPLDFSIPQGSCSSTNFSPVTIPSSKSLFHMTP